MHSDRKICGYCQSAIKNDTEIFYCPGCKTPYHTECWEENEGCAVYGCNEQGRSEHGGRIEDISTEQSIDDMYVNIEFYINERRYVDAITEAKRILESDRESIRAKRYYNKAVSLINNKTKLLDDADGLFEKGDYKGADIYYSNSMQFLPDDERKVVQAKVQWIRERIPYERKRRRIGNILVGSLIVLILAAIIYGGYYYIVLEEDRAYSEIERNDNYEDVKLMEMQLSEYTRFALKYRDGRNYEKASDKVSLLSGILADSLAKSDWKEALKFLKKVDKDRNAKTYTDVYGKIYSAAGVEFNSLVANARKLNSMKKYIEAKKMIEQSLEVVDEFPGSEMADQEKKLNMNVDILSRKISTILKYDNIEAEIDEKQEELQKFGVIDPVIGGNPILNITIEENMGNGVMLARLSEKGFLIALKSEGFGFRIGEYVSIEAKRTGSVEIESQDGKEMEIPMYIPVKTDIGRADSNLDQYAKESILQRLEYLRSQKCKLDSILTIKLF